MRVWLPLAVMLLLACSVFVQTAAFAAVTEVTIAPVDDTYSSYPFDDTAACGAAGNFSIVHGGESTLIPMCAGASFASWHAMMKYNMSQPLSKIIVAANFSVTKTINQCPNEGVSLFVSTNNTWNQSEAVQTLASYKNVMGTILVPTVATHYGNLSVTDPVAMLGMYNASPDDFESFQTVNNGVACGAGGDRVFLQSTEGGANPPTWRMTLADFQTSTGTFTFNFLNQIGYFDFESGNGSFSNFDAADFSYNIGTNTLTPLHGVLAVPTSSDFEDTSNGLASQTCSSQSGYSTSQINSINLPISNFWNICFNLSAQHGGRGFTGAIKVINNTGNDFIFYFAQYSPEYVTLSNFTVSPSSPRGTQNVSITWSSTQPLTGYVRYFSTDINTNQSSPTGTAFDQNYPNLSISHTAVIPNVQANSNYFVMLLGDNSNNETTSTSFQFAFTVGSNLGSPALDSPFINNPNYTSSLVVIPVDSAGTPVTAYATSNINCKLGFDYLPANTNYFFEPMNATIGAWVLFLGNFYIGSYVNVSCIDTQGKYNESTASILIDELPKIYYLNMVQRPQPCSITLVGFGSENECFANLNNSMAAAWYCSYQPNTCRETNTQTGQCSAYGTWNGYQCGACSEIPSGFVCNGSASIGSLPNGTSGNAPSVIFGGLGNIFGISAESAALMLAMFIIGTILIYGGIKVKSASPLVFGGTMYTIGFYGLGWVPIWVPIILAVIAAFMVSKFIVQSVSPSGTSD